MFLHFPHHVLYMKVISVASVLKYREYTQDSHQWQMQLLLEQLASQVSHKTIKVIFNQQITESGSLSTAASSCDFFLIPAPEGNRKVYYWSVLLLEADTGTLPALSRGTEYWFMFQRLWSLNVSAESQCRNLAISNLKIVSDTERASVTHLNFVRGQFSFLIVFAVMRDRLRTHSTSYVGLHWPLLILF